MTLKEFNKHTESFKIVLFYFSSPQCMVCKSLKPKVVQMCKNHFPLLPVFDIESIDSQEITGQLMLFNLPTIICFFEGKEIYRKSRFINIEELKFELQKYYTYSL